MKVLKPPFPVCFGLAGVPVEPHLGLIFSSGLRFHGFPYGRLTQGPCVLPVGRRGRQAWASVPVDFLLQASPPAFSRTPNSLQFSVFFNKLPNCLYSYFAEDKHLEASDSNQDCCYFNSPFGGHRCHFQLIFSFVGKAGSETVISEFSLPVNRLSGLP